MCALVEIVFFAVTVSFYHTNMHIGQFFVIILRHKNKPRSRSLGAVLVVVVKSSGYSKNTIAV